MPRPTVSEVTEELYEILKPVAFADEQHDYALLVLSEAIVGQLQLVNDLSAAQTVDGKEYPPWSQVVDIDRTPDVALPWLAQFVGVVAPPGSGEEYNNKLRDYIRSTPGFTRGSPAAIVAAAQLYLSGGKTVIFRERDGGAYKLTIKTRRIETPVEDWETTNLVANPSLEVNTTGWSTGGTNSIARVLTRAKYGVASLLCTYSNSTLLGSIAITPTANTHAALSAWIWVPTDWDGGQINIRDGGTFAGATLVSSVDADLSKRDQWQRIQAIYLLSADVTGTFTINAASSPSVGKTIFVDGAQAEVHDTATPYTDTVRAAGSGPVGKAILSQKPAGITLNYMVADGQDYQQLLDGFATYQLVFTTYTTYQNVLEDQ